MEKKSIKKIGDLLNIYNGMDKLNITESQVKDILFNLLNEQASGVSRQDYSKVQFKIEELEHQLVETIRELRKLNDAVPEGLKAIVKGRLDSTAKNLEESQKLVKQIKERVRKHKKQTFSRQLDEKKKK